MSGFQLKPLALASLLICAGHGIAYAQDTDEPVTLVFKEGQFILNIPYLEFQTADGNSAYSARLTSVDVANFAVDFTSIRDVELKVVTPVVEEKPAEIVDDTDTPVDPNDDPDNTSGLTDADKELLNLPTDNSEDSQDTEDSKDPVVTDDIASPNTTEVKNIPSPVVGDDEPSAFSDTLKTHNLYRAEVGVANIVWSNEVAKSAQAWADSLQSKGCPLEHSGGQYGENIYWARGFTPTMYDAVTSWGDEKFDYDYATNSCTAGKVCGHYTQVVWENSQYVGCGSAKCDDETVVVCQYNPAGNFIGQKPY